MSGSVVKAGECEEVERVGGGEFVVKVSKAPQSSLQENEPAILSGTMLLTMTTP